MIGKLFLVATALVSLVIPQTQAVTLSEHNSKTEVIFNPTPVPAGTPVPACKLDDTTYSTGICSVCEVVTNFAERYVRQNDTEHMMSKYLDVVCNLLPEHDHDYCVSLIDNNLPYIVNHLEAQYPPEVVCQLLGACNTSDSVVINVFIDYNANSTTNGECTFCEFAVAYVESYLSMNVTETQIETSLRKDCTLLPTEYEKYCEVFIDYILTNENPNEICSTIGLC